MRACDGMEEGTPPRSILLTPRHLPLIKSF